MFATRWQPLNFSSTDWNQLRGEVERAFEQLTGTTFRQFAGSPHPAVNMWEEAEGYVVEAELPGLDLEALEINVDGEGLLTIKGERQAPELEGTWHRQERAFGSFSRTLQLPKDVDADQISAELKNGILTVSLPKKAEVKPRKIVVKTD